MLYPLKFWVSVRPSAPPPFVCPQLLPQFSANPFQTLQALLGWSEDMHIVFSESWNYFLSHFFFIFNLDFFRAVILQKCIGSMYLLPATPPTVLGHFFSIFTGAFRMFWRYAYCFFRILKLFFITFYCIFNLDFLVFFFFFFLELWNNCLLLLFMFNLDCFQPLYYRSA